MMYSVIQQKLKDGIPIILDGAFGTELRRRGVKGVDDPNIWSTRGLLNAPDVVIEIHQDFILAGADVITTGAFRTNSTALLRAGFDNLSRPLTHFAVTLAQEARKKVTSELKRGVAIAGNLTSINDCFTAEVSPRESSYEEHLEKIEYLAEANCDLILIETMPQIDEALAALRAAKTVGKPVWLSLGLASSPFNDDLKKKRYIDNPRMWDDTPVLEIKKRLSESEELPDALLFNCAHPSVVEAAINELGSDFPSPLGAYANVEKPPLNENGEVQWDEAWERDEQINTAAYRDYAMRWVESGIKIIGGCCGITPDDIRSIKAAL